ncbi:hypothetical protein IE53DRAFT_279583 [Violaceomyces palustris]|uniref:Uncharacterized protein n=1 Tax=Violaceomyces palustris TaxID=1673888 RepID=A0ACD0NMC2_9BASI|nr:hypothetical protein IE53DRAFT_279583 [Violaceomyces palustris]
MQVLPSLVHALPTIAPPPSRSHGEDYQCHEIRGRDEPLSRRPPPRLTPPSPSTCFLNRTGNSFPHPYVQRQGSLEELFSWT